MFTYIDLFAGCGGLSLGLQRAGGTHVLAVEKSPMAAETYFHNLLSRDRADWLKHASSNLDSQLSGQLVVDPMSKLLARTDLLESLRKQDLDLVAGGPPCQGFSLAGRRAKDDPRNKLAWEFLDFVTAARPKFVLIENVVGMDTKFRDGALTSPFEDLKTALREMKYVPQGVLLNAVHYGAPQSRPRMMILAARSDVATNLDLEIVDGLWKSKFSDELGDMNGSLTPVPTRARASTLTLGDAVADLGRSHKQPTNVVNQTAYVAEMKNPELWKLTPRTGAKIGRVANGELRAHRDSTKQLFRLLQILTKLELLPIARRARQSDFAPEELDALEKAIGGSINVSSPDGQMKISDPSTLVGLIRTRLTRKHSQTVLDWDKPSRTVVTIPDDYVHPKEPRTFSVRELARLQGFPDDFIFQGKVTTGGTNRRSEVPQYTQVGNAVSPYVALAVGEMIGKLLTAEPAR